MKKKWSVLGLTLAVGLTLTLLNNIQLPAEAKEETKQIEAANQEASAITTITVSGRLLKEQHGKEERLILHSKEGLAYILKGNLGGKLKEALEDLGQDNIVSLSATKDGSYVISCHNSYEFDTQGKRKIETKCIRYYNLDVNEIIEAKESSEELPPLKRDIEEERRALTSTLGQLQQPNLSPPTFGQLEGKISRLNIRSPLKTMKVTYRDKDNKRLKKVFLLSANTRIAQKNVDTEQIMYLTVSSLKAGQKVAVIYSRDERKAEALFITIIGE